MPTVNPFESQLRAALLGLAVGDALGVPVEFSSRAARRHDPVKHMRAYGTHHQPAGTWSDDAALTFCLAEALTEDRYTVRRLADNCIRWYYDQFWTPHGRVFDVGVTTREALQRLKTQLASASPLVGGTDEMSNSNGALMRMLPLAFYQDKGPLPTWFQLIFDASAITHGHIRSAIACFLYLELAAYLRAGATPAEAYVRLGEEGKQKLKELNISAKERLPFDRILTGELASAPESAISSSGYVLHTLEAAMWCLLNYHDFPSTVLAAVNLGDDTDTTGAVVGGLAGICYGEQAIPEQWLEVLARRADIEDLAHRMAAQVTAPAPRPISNSYWATEQVLACEYPGDLDERKARAKLIALLDAGITDFMDLTEVGELIPYEPMLKALAAERGYPFPVSAFPS